MGSSDLLIDYLSRVEYPLYSFLVIPKYFILFSYHLITMDLDQIHEKIFTWFIRFLYVLIIATALGLSVTAPIYLETAENFLRIYICLVLIWRFNPLRSYVFKELDRKIAFHAGIILLTTSVLSQIIEYIKQVV
jgi:hypothetical protein